MFIYQYILIILNFRDSLIKGDILHPVEIKFDKLLESKPFPLTKPMYTDPNSVLCVTNKVHRKILSFTSDMQNFQFQVSYNQILIRILQVTKNLIFTNKGFSNFGENSHQLNDLWFLRDTVFNSVSILTKLDLYGWNQSAVKRAKVALETHFRRQSERNQPQYKIFHLGPIVSYNNDYDRSEITLKNIYSDGFDKFKNPEFDIKARKQTSVAEELTCNGDIAERNDVIYYISMGFTYDSLQLHSEFGIKESPIDGKLAITLMDLTVKIFLQIKEIDENFRCSRSEDVFSGRYTHRVPEFTVKYNLKNIEISIIQNPAGVELQEVNELINHIKNEIMQNKEAVERRIWAYLLPNFTKHVMTMSSVKNIPEILYYVVQNNSNPIFSFDQPSSHDRRDVSFLSFE